MNFTAAMRVGSLEILAALGAFGVIAARLGGRTSPPRPKALALSVAVRDGAGRPSLRQLSVTVDEGTPCLVGRSAQADIALADPDVSRRHARLDLVRGVLYIADLGSRNGTFLNGKALGDEGIELRPGDDVDVGNTRITITDTQAV